MKPSYLANLSHAVHMEKVRSRRHPIFGWDAGPDLAQATWEWPVKKGPRLGQAFFDGLKAAVASYAQMMQEPEPTSIFDQWAKL
jgi:hypothetical protein